METNQPFLFAGVGLTLFAAMLMINLLVDWTEFAKNPIPLTKHGELVADLVLLGGMVIWDALAWRMAFVPSSQKPLWYDLVFILSFPAVGNLMILASVARNYLVLRKYLNQLNGLGDESGRVKMSFWPLLFESFSRDVVEAAIFVSLALPLVYAWFFWGS